jgi:hypothetical protein
MPTIILERGDKMHIRARLTSILCILTTTNPPVSFTLEVIQSIGVPFEPISKSQDSTNTNASDDIYVSDPSNIIPEAVMPINFNHNDKSNSIQLGSSRLP